MIDTLLVGATVKAFEEILEKRGVPYETRKDEEYDIYMKAWDEAGKGEKDLALRQAAPAAERIASKEKYLFEKGGDPLAIRLNYLTLFHYLNHHYCRQALHHFPFLIYH